MVSPIEDYALLSDCHTAALVSCCGGIDWLCMPRFDSASVFGALLGDDEQGRWLLSPVDSAAEVERHYLGTTLALVTRWTCATGVVEVTDVMPLRDKHAELVRRVRGISGTVRMRQELRLRFDYARTLPWVRQEGTEKNPLLIAVAGPDAVVVRGVRLTATDHVHAAEFDVTAGSTLDLSMAWFPSHQHVPKELDVDRALERTQKWWTEWASAIDYDGPHRSAVVRSLLTLRALTDNETGGIVAAATTSLPEQFGGSRNWDYRYVWLRDAALTLQALLAHGFGKEAQKWRAWLLRAVAGAPEDVQIMYGLAGERHLPEHPMPSLPGYDGASPVRIGNAAVDQYQADVIGEVMVALHEARQGGVEETEFSWPLQRALLGFIEQNWQRPDNGIWEIRGEPRHFTHSRVMVWAALDRGVRGVRECGLDGPVETWEALRDQIRTEIETHGFSTEHGHFVQSYGSTEVDSSLLLLPMVGFIAADDPRMLGTVAELERVLLHGGLLHRYRTESSVDGLSGSEHPFLACSFWLVYQYAHSGRLEDAEILMDRIVSLCNDVGLLSEEYDVENHRHAGNTPQALSHLALVTAADALCPARSRR
ncbi:glycoside hydrolase family 15 protein [Rathayibacter toxicus]|uniref:Glucoamylase n=1 Tax=Rathayibacter toxicus TaxID=145458 RepID=A0A0C5B934_9MICO|nr:glycoside hydrolase family 15 protein [Rathayibacter toxicus]AJM77353.1 glucoamylase [Rathayibacter toxicus]ALS56761.1 glucoamylase [Rathayibacter toxicus]KKM46391.1 glucoamylase [Rathayibacter toxicus]PPG23378.1 glycoside hydrolase family 15 protein [Rathayibacter toxicus]PPG47962.1 glycoside hydrolase family 15 protein [Rathayibacter toxicus]